MGLLILGNEQVSRHLSERVENPRVVNPTGGDLMLDHLDAPIPIVHTSIVATAGVRT